jgi:PadR family transcriptional regulator PadR
MKNKFIENWESQIKKGILDYLVLTTLKNKPLYGQKILNLLKENYNLDVAEGTLFPKLKRMKAEGLLLSEWRNQENDLGSPVKFYYMTGQGKQLFNDMRVYIEDILQPILLTA